MGEGGTTERKTSMNEGAGRMKEEKRKQSSLSLLISHTGMVYN